MILSTLCYIEKDNQFFTVKFEYDGDKLLRYNLKEY